MFRGKNKIDLPDRIYDNPLQHFPLLNTILGAVEAHYEPVPTVALDGVDTPHASMIREVGLSEEVVPMSEPSKVQKLVQQHLENLDQTCKYDLLSQKFSKFLYLRTLFLFLMLRL